MKPTMWVCFVFATLLVAQDPPQTGMAVHLWVGDYVTPDAAMKSAMARFGITGMSAEGPAGIAAARASGLPFYVDYAVPKGRLHVRADTFDAARRAWFAGSPARRTPCLRDPTARDRAFLELGRTLEALGDARPRFLSLADEPSETSGLNPLDACTCERCIAALVPFLVARWGTEARAREAWGPRWPKNGLPRPPSSDDARRALFHDMGWPGDVVAWHDMRAFADAGFADDVAALAERVRLQRPDVSVALLGLNIPSLFGGLAPESLAPLVGTYEAYTDAGADDLWHALAPTASKRVATVWLDRRPEEIRARLWHAWLTDVDDVVLFRDTHAFGSPTAPQPGDAIRTAGDVIATVGKSSASAWRTATPLPPQAAILHGMPSVRVRGLLDTRWDGAGWVNRLSSWEESQSTAARARRSWTALFRDLGLVPTFTTSERLRGQPPADLAALVLSHQSALSDADCRRIREFAADRLVVADTTPACFTARLERRAVPALDDLFGVTRGGPDRRTNRPPTIDELALPPVRGDARAVEAAEPSLAPSGTNASDTADGRTIMIQRNTGSGRALLLNLAMRNYAEDRFTNPARAERLRTYLRSQLQGLRLRPTIEPAVVDGTWPFTMHLRRSGDDLLVAVESDLPPEFLRNAPPASATTLRLALPGIYDVEDLIVERPLGPMNAVTLTVSLGAPALLRLRRH